VIVLNKADLVSKAQLAQVSDQLSILNPRALVLPCENSKINVMKVVDTSLYKALDFAGLHRDDVEEEEGKMKDCCKAKVAVGELPCCRSKRTHDSGKSKVVVAHNRASKPDTAGNSQKPRHASRFGITSFIYQARRPFHPERFDSDFVQKYFVFQSKDGDDEEEDEEEDAQVKGKKKLSKAELQKEEERKKELAIMKQQTKAKTQQGLRMQEFGELIRSKGFLWLANRHDMCGMMSHAGSVIGIEFNSPWVVLERRAWQGTETELAAVRNNWVDPWGDRRQDLVFIGKDLRHDAIQKVLDGCLLTDEEMKLGIDGWKATMGDILLESALEGGDSDEEEE